MDKVGGLFTMDFHSSSFQDLFARFSNIRKTRGDGNCFYRAYGFNTLESCLIDTELSKRYASQTLVTFIHKVSLFGTI